jgi:hypothetical protein
VASAGFAIQAELKAALPGTALVVKLKLPANCAAVGRTEAVALVEAVWAIVLW